MVAKRKSTSKPSTKATRRRGLRANDLQALIALEDWDAIARAVATEAVSYATLRSVVQGYQDLAQKGHARAEAILARLQEAGVRAGFRRRGPRAARIAFDEPVPRKIQVVENKKTGHKTYLLSGLSLKPYVEPEKGVKALPEDLEVQVVYRKNGTIEIHW